MINKIDFKINGTVKDKEEHYIMTKGRIQQEDINLINMNKINIEAPAFLWQILIDVKGEIIGNGVIVVVYINTPLTSMD